MKNKMYKFAGVESDQKSNKLSRRSFINRSLAGAGALTVGASPILASCDSGNFSRDEKLPNIILITADDLGWKDLGCYGNKQIKTPNLDRLAEGGVRFTNAFVVSSSCAPSRASLITGQYPHTNGVTALTHIKKTRSLSPFAKTLPDLLKERGYNTALIGKWHPSPYIPVSFYGYQNRLSGLFPKSWKIENADKINGYVEENRDNRFFIEINFMQNHRDDLGEFDFAEGFPYDPEKVTVPEYWTLPNWPEIREEVAEFYSRTEQMDHIIGQMLDKLEELGLESNTLVVFMSDNGAPFPGNKMTLYDRGTGTPLIMRYPDKIKSGTVNEMLTNTIDIMPTVLDAVGLPISEEIEGKSFYSQVTGTSTNEPNEAVYMEMTDHVFYIPTRAVRNKRWKYIRNYSDIALGLDQNNHMEWAHRLCELPNQPWKKPRVRQELYDLQSDPHEQNNLAEDAQYASVLTEMSGLLDRHMKQTADPYLGAKFTSDYGSRSYEMSKPGEK